METTTTTTYELEVEPGRVVTLRELTAEEFEAVVRHSASSENKDWELQMQGLRYAIVRDGNQKLTYPEMVGPLLAKRFRVRPLLLLRQAFEHLHMPSAEESGRVKAMRVVVA